MTSLEEHKRKIIEHLEELADAIEIGMDKRPATIGFHCSACSTELFEAYLHAINAIPTGKLIKHEWFKKPKQGQKVPSLAERRIGLDFPIKDQLYPLLYEIEDSRNHLIYGRPSHHDVEDILIRFNELKSLIITELNKRGVKIG